MGLFKDMVSGIRQIIVSDDDDNLFDQQDSFFEQPVSKKPVLPTLKPLKEKNKNSIRPTGLNFDLNSYDINQQKSTSKKMANKGHIQVYVPKNFEESFDIINVVKDGVTVMVNVELCNPQVSQRIVDILTGALVALNGQCKKMGEKQYIFSLNAEMSGAIDYVPNSGQNQFQNGYGYQFQNPFANINPFSSNQNYQNNDMKQNSQLQNQFNQRQFNNVNQSNYNNFQNGQMNNQNNNSNSQNFSFDPNNFYNPPVSQF